MEEDYKLFQLIRRNPINNCVDLSKNMIGKRSGFIYFTENFRIDFENKMANQARLQEENERLQKENEELKSKHYFINGLRCGKSLLKQNVERAAEFERLKKENEYLKLHYQKSIIEQKNMIPKQKIKEKIEELNKQYDFYNSDRRETKNIAKGYYIAIQKLQELLESEEKKMIMEQKNFGI